MLSAIFWIGKAGEARSRIIRARGGDGAEFLGQGFGDLGGVAGNDDGGSVYAATAAVFGDGRSDEVKELGPAIDLIFADEDFAVAGAVDFDGGILGVLLGGGAVAEEEGASAGFENFGGAFVVCGVEAEGGGRASGGDESLDESVGRPRFIAAGFDDDRGFEGDGREPEGIHGGRIAWHDEAERLGSRIKAERCAELLADASVEDGQVEASGKTIQDGLHVNQGVADAGHVAIHHHVRQAAGGGERFEIFARGLGVALVAEGEGGVREKVGGLCADGDELRGRQTVQGSSSIRGARKIFAQDTGVDLADEGADGAGAVIFNLGLIEATVRFSPAKGGEMRDRRHEANVNDKTRLKKS